MRAEQLLLLLPLLLGLRVRVDDNGIDHNQSWLRSPYLSTFWRSHDLHPNPYCCCRCWVN
jgi:hypothetical protein